MVLHCIMYQQVVGRKYLNLSCIIEPVPLFVAVDLTIVSSANLCHK